jgi:hypothetical protein
MVTLERDGVIDVLEQVNVHADGRSAAAYEITMRRGELFAQPSIFVNEHRFRAGDGKQAGTFRISRGSRGIRYDWQQPAGPGSVRLGYRLALLGTAYTDVVDLRVPVWERDWEVAVRELTATLKLPRAAHGRVYTWVEPQSLDATLTKTSREVRMRTQDVPARTAVTLRVVFPRNVLSSFDAVKVQAKPGLTAVLAERRGGDGRAWWPWAVAAAIALAVSAVALRTVRSRRPPQR